jgi:hypothetical protein
MKKIVKTKKQAVNPKRVLFIGELEQVTGGTLPPVIWPQPGVITMMVGEDA